MAEGPARKKRRWDVGPKDASIPAPSGADGAEFATQSVVKVKATVGLDQPDFPHLLGATRTTMAVTAPTVTSRTPAPIDIMRQQAAEIAARLDQSLNKNAPILAPPTITSTAAVAPPPSVHEGMKHHAAAHLAHLHTTATPPVLVQPAPPQSFSHGPPEEFVDVEINDVPMEVRSKVTKRAFLKSIEEYADVSITVNGRYHAMNAAAGTETERPLYLHITSPKSKQQHVVDWKARLRALAKASCLVEDVLSSKTSSELNNWNTLLDRNQSKNHFLIDGLGDDCVERKLRFGVTNIPSAFNVSARMAGPNGSYIEHIERTTGVAVRLCEDGEDGEEEGEGVVVVLSVAMTSLAARKAFIQAMR